MAKVPKPQITAWSYSRLSTYLECPAKAKYKFIDKLQEPPNPAMERGTAMHKAAEDYLGGKLKTYPADFHKGLKKYFADLKKRKPKVEEEMAFDNRWSYLGERGWFSPMAWLRVKMDASARDKDPTIIDVVDHKSGKNRGGYEEQLELYGLAYLLLHPTIKVVRSWLWFLDSGERIPFSVKRKDLDNLLKKWEKKVKPMLADTRFAPKPGNACRWCHFKKGNNGPCKF